MLLRHTKALNGCFHRAQERAVWWQGWAATTCSQQATFHTGGHGARLDGTHGRGGARANRWSVKRAIKPWRRRIGLGHAELAGERRRRRRVAPQEGRANHTTSTTEADVRRVRCVDRSWGKNEIRQKTLPQRRRTSCMNTPRASCSLLAPISCHCVRARASAASRARACTPPHCHNTAALV